MKIEKVHAVYFSPTGTTKTVITHLVKCITTLLPEVVTEVKDFTLPSGRKKVPDIRESELAIVGLPVYAGRLPNLLLNYLTTWQSNGAWAVPVVVYGNRSYGNALVELYDILTDKLLNTVFKKRPGNPCDDLADGKEKFVAQDVFTQTACLLQIIGIFGRICLQIWKRQNSFRQRS